MKRPPEILRLKIDGPGIRSGGISVPDLLTICEQAQNAVNRQAEAMEGRQSLRRGPKIARVHVECTLELVALKRGSTTLGFVIAKPQQPLPNVTSLGEEVVARVVEAIESLGGANVVPGDVDSGVLDSLKNMGDVFDRRSVDSIEWVLPRRRSHGSPRRATYTKIVRKRVLERIKPPLRKSVVIEGTLEMADFKEADQKCRIHPLLGNPIICTFDKEKEDEIYAALRNPVRITGNASISSQTGRTESIHIQKLEPLEPLSLGVRDFFLGKSIEELAHDQGVKPIESTAVLAGGLPQEEDADEMLEEIYRERET